MTAASDRGAPPQLDEGASMFERRLRELGLELPRPSSPGANYVQFVRTGELLFLTGQLSQWNGERRFIGKLGREFGVADGQAAARLCALNLLAHLREAVRDHPGRVVRCVRVTGYVNATDDFTEHSQVVNGASDLLVAVLGEAGRHTRMAIGTNGLPYGVAVEVEALFEIR
jgi:enamine deaminase RidA (YjgF/YER057c/UK114 family)